jgi:acyl phosphate:glycerol-3-phosphate acyltransferase
METFKISFAILSAYLIGAIPTAVWLGKAFYGIDVRNSGSGNPGATNTFRVLGKKAGIPVLIIDILKGYFAVMLAHLVFGSAINQDFVTLQLFLGLAAVIGHIFPVYSGFKGGKGIATLLGVMLAINPMAAGLAILAFIITLLTFKMVSLASILGSVFFALSILVFFHTFHTVMVPFSLLVVVMVIFTHQKNIERLLKKEESKVKLFKKK